MNSFDDFKKAIAVTTQAMKDHARQIQRGKWQGIPVDKRPEMVAYEILHWTMRVPMPVRNLDHYRAEIKPNLPWADDHFLERVSGHPLNPGKEWANWPWGASAGNFRYDPASLGDPGEEKIFDHTYMMRYWPKYACMFKGGVLPHDKSLPDVLTKRGIYFPYGDLKDVVDELANDPTTRQAILPVFFPEDTGRRNGRKPCSISYHFMLNTQHRLDIFYHLRSCDLMRHFNDDIYLTVRLLLWMLDQLEDRNPFWRPIRPGDFVMYIGNLHCFKNDMIRLRGYP